MGIRLGLDLCNCQVLVCRVQQSACACVRIMHEVNKLYKQVSINGWKHRGRVQRLVPMGCVQEADSSRALISTSIGFFPAAEGRRAGRDKGRCVFFFAGVRTLALK